MSRYDEYIELLRQMVRIPSVSFEEGGVADLLSDYLSRCGIPIQRYGHNIIALNSHFDRSLKTLMMDAHIDTVPPGESYSFDPFDPGNDEEIVRGLGSNDDGGCVVSSIATFRHFFNVKLPFNLMLSISCEEERSGPAGMRMLFSLDGPLSGNGNLPHPDWALVCEPTAMKAATSERGLLVLDGVATGTRGHAARGEGVNALYKALDDIEVLRRHRFARVSERMGEVRLNVTCISAGEAHNVIPDRCSFVVDVRPTDCYTNEEILSELQGFCRSELRPRNLSNRSSASRAASPLVKAAESLGIETFSSPTTSNWMRIDCDAIKMGPGESARSHKSDEFIKVSEIEEGIDTYMNFIDRFYGYTLE